MSMFNSFFHNGNILIARCLNRALELESSLEILYDKATSLRLLAGNSQKLSPQQRIWKSGSANNKIDKNYVFSKMNILENIFLER